ncbi:ABC transporter substrate-binding protein [Desulfococcaceae bacterium HSG8]|nr:ABC transporter substrate-binding protein [Desulfococcaceae bacterium HSG8]
MVKRMFAAALFFIMLCGVAQAEKVRINFWHAFGGGRTAFIQRMADDFNYTHPNIEVKVDYKGSYRDTLNASILAAKQKQAPHIVQIFEVGSQLALDSGIFTPFQDYVNDSDYAMLDDYIAPVANYYTINGKFNSIPWNSSNPVLYYNKNIFKKAGLDPENPPKTYKEVIAACEKIVSSKAAPKGITWPLHTWFVEQWISMQGALLANNENGRAGRATDIFVNSDDMKRIMSWLKTLYDKGYYAYSGKPEDWDGANQIFITQQAAMLITSTSDVTFHQNTAAENGYELGTGFLPAPDGIERNGVVVGGASLWMTQGHSKEESDAAKTFLLWFTNTENMVRWHKGTGYFPVRKSAVDVVEKQKWFEKNPAYRAAFDQLLQTKVNRASQGAMVGCFPELRTIITDAVQKIFAGGKIDKVLADADKRADKALADYNSSVE